MLQLASWLCQGSRTGLCGRTCQVVAVQAGQVEVRGDVVSLIACWLVS